MNRQPDPANEGLDTTQPYPPDAKAQHDAPGTAAPQGLAPSSAVNASFDTGAGQEALGHDSPPITSSQLGNSEVESTPSTDDQHAADPYYPPGGGIPPERERRAERLDEE
ncbi:hypothetical protein [Kallotenue papyrolyticum]|uniref:hypothetical protein n=1 Tax=Kallotenue papyrolyticum TaxID=1325125 RepID=UPI00047860BA|nr:hypothetical protein [Kallotenue papyrolyticum]